MSSEMILGAVPESSGLTEDIGLFDDPGPSLNPLQFSVPKPGLKSSRKVTRGKGVPSSVLAADGSVTQQQASML